MTKKMLVENPGLEFALVQIFGKLGDKAQPQTDVEHADSGPGNNLNEAVSVRKAAGKIGHAMPFTEQRLTGGRESIENPSGVNESRLVQAGTSTLPVEGKDGGNPNSAPAYVPLHQEVVIEVTRYGENGEPLTVKVLGSAKHTKESRTWTACPEAEVVETNGDFHAGEVLSLFPEEQVEVATQAEREWLND